MSQVSHLHQLVDARFRKVFGTPTNTHAKDDQWSLRSAPNKNVINVLVNGGVEEPVVWIFDSDDQVEGVFRTSITKEEQIDGIIIKIQERMKHAHQSTRQPW